MDLHVPHICKKYPSLKNLLADELKEQKFKLKTLTSTTSDIVDVTITRG